MRRAFSAIVSVLWPVSFALHGGVEAQTDQASEDAAMINSFVAFAAEEWPRIVDSIETGYEHAVETMDVVQLPMTSKQMYSALWLSEKPTTYVTDVFRTNSLQQPLKGTIAFTVRVERGTLVLKGPREHCRGKPLQECLLAGGKIAEEGPGLFNPFGAIGGKTSFAQATEVILSYGRNDDKWERIDTRSVIDLVNTMPSLSSTQERP